MTDTWDFYPSTATEFLGQHTWFEHGQSISLDALFARYQHFCRGKQISYAGRRWFGRFVREHATRSGFDMRAKQRNGRMFYIGLGLKH
jgi:hypothetical protein